MASKSKAPSITVMRPKGKQTTIDIYNSTSTGHQVGSGVSKPSSYHKSRTAKLQQQFRCKPPPLASLITKPTDNGDRKDYAKAPVVSTLLATAPSSSIEHVAEPQPCKPLLTPVTNPAVAAPKQLASCGTPVKCTQTPLGKAPQKRIFANCTIYVNGTTAPLISDIMLKRHLSSQGASIAIGLTRKSVTHVILGKPNKAGAGGGRAGGGAGGGGGAAGAGGGLAAGKLHKELTKNGKSVKFVSVNWVLDSLKAGKRLPESQYTVLDLRSEKQKNILPFVQASEPTVAKS